MSFEGPHLLPNGPGPLNVFPHPLPNGPGPLNVLGEKTAIKQTMQNYKNNIASSSRQSRQDGSGVIREFEPGTSTGHGSNRGTSEKDKNRTYFRNLSEKFAATSVIRPRRSTSQVNFPSSSKSSFVEVKNCFDVNVRVNSSSSDRNLTSKYINSQNVNGIDLSTTMRNERMRSKEVPVVAKSMKTADKPKNLDETNGCNGGQVGRIGHVSEFMELFDVSRTSLMSRSVVVTENKCQKNDRDIQDNTEAATTKLRLSPPDSSRACRGQVGLENLGNTCFMNSILQCLSNTRLLLEFCLGGNYLSDINTCTSSMKGSMIKAYANLMESMWKSKSYSSIISPTDFKYNISKFARKFVGTREHDAHEFLVYLLEGLHEDLNRIYERKKRFIDCSDQVEMISAPEKARLSWQLYIECDNSKIIDIFMGQLRSALTCKKCGYVSNTFEPFLALSLPIKQAGSQVSLFDCFKLFSLEETLDGDNKPKCARCRTRNACTKQMSLQKFPKILIIHLMRFKHGTSSKLNTRVSCPVTDLDLSQFTTASSSCSAVYNLYAISNHSGTPLTGHSRLMQRILTATTGIYLTTAG